MILTTATVQEFVVATTPVVHTTGINWISVTTIIVGITVVMSALLSVIARYIANRVTDSINRLRIDVVDKIDTRLSVVEKTLELINRNNPDRRIGP